MAQRGKSGFFAASRPRRAIPVVACLCNLLLTATVVAQPTAAETSAPAFCFWPRPLPSCQSFVLTEVGLAFMIGDAVGREKRRTFLWLDLGWMRNTSGPRAWGGSFHLAVNDNAYRLGFKVRGRHWISRDIAFELAPGFIVDGGNDDLESETCGLMAHAEISYRDWLGVRLQFDYLFGDVPGVLLGFRFGSGAGAAVIGLASLLTLTYEDSS